MTIDPTEAAFVAAGYGPAEAHTRAALTRRAGQTFTASAGHDALWRWFVPGRVEVFGKHTDYAGGRSLMSAVPRGFAVLAAPRDDGRVVVRDAADGDTIAVDAGDGTPALQGWGAYVATVVRRLAANFPGARLGTDVVILGDLPPAAGLSSSSALVVGVASALIRRGRLDETPHWRDTIPSPYHLAWYLGCVENGLDYPGLSGTAGVGTLGGSEDSTAILTCRAGHLSQNRYAPVAHLGEVPMPADWTFVVATSGVRADKAGAALERYNRLSRATAELRDLWCAQAGHAHVPTLAAALAAAPDAPSRLDALLAASPEPALDRDWLRRRLAHFVREDGRVPAAAAAVGAGDRSAVAALAAASQDEADRLLGNQIPETRDLAAAALEAGAFAASSFGAGFGGSVWALCDRADAARLGAAWLAAYRHRQPQAATAEWFVAMPGPARVALATD